MNDEFVKRAKYFQTFRDNPYQIIRLDLSVARNNEHIVRAGDLTKIVHASSASANIDIRFNNDSYPTINFATYRKVETFYKDLYVTNAAQAGEWVDLLLAVKEWFDMTDFFFRLDALSAGLILMWSGTIATIPAGWVLCDGINPGTPDLRDKFIVGARQDDGPVAKTNVTGALTQSGGALGHAHDFNGYGHTHTFTGNGHDHSMSYSQYTDGSGSYYCWDAMYNSNYGYASGTTDNGAASGTTDNTNELPPYYALAFIMKT